MNENIEALNQAHLVLAIHDRNSQAAKSESGRGAVRIYCRSMRSLLFLLFVLSAVALESCGSEPKQPASEPKRVETPKPADESRRFPQANLVNAKVIDDHLLGKSFMPGGTLAHYQKGKTEYDMFVARMPSPTDAAILLPDWRKALAGARLVPSFGGYFGQDDGRPVFVFTKDAWVAGVVGLSEKEADMQARALAARLD